MGQYNEVRVCVPLGLSSRLRPCLHQCVLSSAGRAAHLVHAAADTKGVQRAIGLLIRQPLHHVHRLHGIGAALQWACVTYAVLFSCSCQANDIVSAGKERRETQTAYLVRLVGVHAAIREQHQHLQFSP